MAKRQPREQPDDEDTDRNGSADGGAVDEQELASYLEERIKPGLNRGAIPLVARSIAREIARDYYGSDDAEEDEDEYEDEEAADLEADLHELQQRLGEDWTLIYAVHGGDAWLAAETQDAAQRVEAATADVLVKAVAVLNKGGSRSGARRSQPEDDSD